MTRVALRYKFLSSPRSTSPQAGKPPLRSQVSCLPTPLASS